MRAALPLISAAVIGLCACRTTGTEAPAKDSLSDEQLRGALELYYPGTAEEKLKRLLTAAKAFPAGLQRYLYDHIQPWSGDPEAAKKNLARMRRAYEQDPTRGRRFFADVVPRLNSIRYDDEDVTVDQFAKTLTRAYRKLDAAHLKAWRDIVEDLSPGQRTLFDAYILMLEKTKTAPQGAGDSFLRLVRERPREFKKFKGALEAMNRTLERQAYMWVLFDSYDGNDQILRRYLSEPDMIPTSSDFRVRVTDGILDEPIMDSSGTVIYSYLRRPDGACVAHHRGARLSLGDGRKYGSIIYEHDEDCRPVIKRIEYRDQVPPSYAEPAPHIRSQTKTARLTRTRPKIRSGRPPSEYAATASMSGAKNPASYDIPDLDCLEPAECPSLTSKGRALLQNLEVPTTAQYVSFLPFDRRFGVFQDSRPSAWGEGKVLGALWRHDLPFESSLRGLAIIRGQAVFIESPKEWGSLSTLWALDPFGHKAGSVPMRGGATALTAGSLGKNRVLIAREVPKTVILDLARGATGEIDAPIYKFAFADLGGTQHGALVAADEKTPSSLTAYGEGGRVLWRRNYKGIEYLIMPLAARFPGDSSDTLMVFGGSTYEYAAFLIDAEGKLTGKRVLKNWHLRRSLAAFDRRGSRLAAVHSHVSGNHDFLRVWSVDRDTWTLHAEADLGWATPFKMTLADLDGDGSTEIVLGTQTGWVLVYSSDAELLSEDKFVSEISHLASGDVTGDGVDDVLVGVKSIPPTVSLLSVADDPRTPEAQREFFRNTDK